MISFNEYLEDVLDLQSGLMSREQMEAAREGYARFVAPKPRDPKHPDLKKSITELVNRCERLVDGQARDIAKFDGREGYEAAVVAAKEAVAEGRRLLAAKRPTKADLIAHAAMNSAASRAMNDAAQA